MSRLLPIAILAAALCGTTPLFAQTPQQIQQQQQNQAIYGNAYNYGQDFLYGNSQQEEEQKKLEQSTWQYSSKYKYNPGTNEPGKKELLIPPGQMLLYLVRTENTENDEVTVRLVSPVSVTGCLNLIPPIVTMQKGGSRLIFKIEDAEIALDKTVRYAHFQCHQGSNIATADITLSRAELQGGRIKTLSFQGISAMDNYNLDLSGDTLSLTAETSAAFKPFMGTSKPDPLVYNFYPDDAVILFTPSAAKTGDLTAEIATLAQSKGMAEGPLLKKAAAPYFIDRSGALAGSLDYGASAFVGTITTQETFRGPRGEYRKEKPLDVYARRPGLLD